MEHSQFVQYLAVLMLFVIAVGAVGGMMILSVLLGKRARRTRIKDTAYECGMIPTGPGSARFSVKFHLVAMLFILFDIEVVFLYPWAVSLRQLGTFSLIPILILILVVLVGYIYAWRKNVLEWK